MEVFCYRPPLYGIVRLYVAVLTFGCKITSLFSTFRDTFKKNSLDQKGKVVMEKWLFYSHVTALVNFHTFFVISV